MWRQRHVRCTFSATNTDACIPRGFYLYVYSSLRLAHFSGMRILEMWTVIKAQLAPFFCFVAATLSLWERRFTNHYRNRKDCPLIRTVFDQDSTDKQDSLQSNIWVVMFICSSMILCYHMMSSSSYRISHKSFSFEFISNYKKNLQSQQLSFWLVLHHHYLQRLYQLYTVSQRSKEIFLGIVFQNILDIF